jgi:hypothetical protein
MPNKFASELSTNTESARYISFDKEAKVSVLFCPDIVASLSIGKKHTFLVSAFFGG